MEDVRAGRVDAQPAPEREREVVRVAGVEARPRLARGREVDVPVEDEAVARRRRVHARERGDAGAEEPSARDQPRAGAPGVEVERARVEPLPVLGEVVQPVPVGIHGGVRRREGVQPVRGLPGVGEAVSVRVVRGVLHEVEPRAAFGRQGPRPGGDAAAGPQDGLQRPPLHRHGAVPAEEGHRADGAVRDGERHPPLAGVEGQVGEAGPRGRGGAEPGARRNERRGQQAAEHEAGPDRTRLPVDDQPVAGREAALGRRGVVRRFADHQPSVEAVPRQLEPPEQDGVSAGRTPRRHVRVEAAGPAVHLRGEDGREVGPERDEAVGHDRAGGDAGKPRDAPRDLVAGAGQGGGGRRADDGPTHKRRRKTPDPGHARHTPTSSLAPRC